MSVYHSGVSPRARLTVAAVLIGAVTLLAFLVLTYGSRIGATITGSADTTMAGQAIPASAGVQNPEELRKEALNKISGLPLYFEANRGQVDPSVRYLARSGRYSLFLTDDAAVFSLIGGEFHKGPMPAGFPYKAGGDTNLTESAVRVRLVGANQHPQVEGLEPLPGRVNYLIGRRKRTGIATSRPSAACDSMTFIRASTLSITARRTRSNTISSRRRGRTRRRSSLRSRVRPKPRRPLLAIS